MEVPKWRHFNSSIILKCVRWYCKYGISYRDIEEMMSERGISVSHTTIMRWVHRYAPELEKKMRRYSHFTDTTWYVDETYVKVKGVWKYLYRAIDRFGRTLDFYLSHRRNGKAAYRFLRKVLGRCQSDQRPSKINTDKAGCYENSIASLIKEERLDKDVEHRTVKYLNNLLESDHGKLKRLINPGLGFEKMKTALATIKGYELMRMFKKQQFDLWMGFPKNKMERIQAEIRLIQAQFA